MRIIAPLCQPPPHLIEVQLAVEQRGCLDVCEPFRRPAPAQAVALAALGTLREVGWDKIQERECGTAAVTKLAWNEGRKTYMGEECTWCTLQRRCRFLGSGDSTPETT